MAEMLMDGALERLRAAAAKHVGDTRVPGLVALVARGDEVHVEALGTLAVGGSPVARDSIFRIASTSKPITAAATLALVGEGLIGLDEPVDRLLPELAGRRVLRRMDGPLDETVPATRSITTRDLLTFTFGFGLVSWGFGQSVLDSGVYGWDGGLGTSWLVDPNHDLVVIVLTQRMFESPEPPQVHRDIQAAAYAALAS
jgi:CubicO group peptidase (beta-lactamase class C family)